MHAKLAKNPKITAVGPGFVMYKNEIDRTRGRIVRIVSSLNAINPPRVVVPRLESAAELDRHLAQRIAFTVMKRQLLIALTYTLNGTLGNVVIGGASDQDRSGSSSCRQSGGRTFWLGTQAGHIAIGTYWANGNSVGRQTLARLFALAHGHLIPRRNVALAYSSFSALAGEALYLDGATESVPAFVNQSCAHLEHAIFSYLNANPPVVASDPAQLEKISAAAAYTYIDKLPVLLTRSVKQRLAALKIDPTSEIRQDPGDTRNCLFSGSESTFLQESLARLTGAHGHLNEDLALTLNDCISYARDTAGAAEEARAEYLGPAPSLRRVE